MTHTRSFIPAAGHDRWLRFYDPMTKLMGAPRALDELIAQAQLQPGQRALDIGCGTGTLAVRLERRYAEVTIVGLDPDPNALAIARHKAANAKVDVDFVQAFADQIPYPDSSFDRVFSSFMLHHLTAEQQRCALTEARRVLTPSGSLHVLDFAAPHRQPTMIEKLLNAGFGSATCTATQRVLLFRIEFHRASHH